MDGLGIHKAARILIVEDDPELRDLARSILEPQGYEVLEATDGAAALEIADSCYPDLVLLDLMIPVLDGWGVLRALRSDPESWDLPVVIVTAHDSMPSHRRGWEEGTTEYLVKPYDPSSLLTLVRELLDARPTVTREQRRLHALGWLSTHRADH